MSWFNDLLFGNGVAHTILLLAFVIAAGVMLGKVKIFGISLGMTLVLFVGIAVSHFGLRVDGHVLHFVKEFGLILFVFAVGLQVGPGFVASFKKGGVRLNMLATLTVLLGVGVTVAIHYISSIPMPTMVGILSGAVTNTPGLGAAQEASAQLQGVADPTIALGYAVAYPLGVVGIILAIVAVKYMFRINLDRETEALCNEQEEQGNAAEALSLEVMNPAIFGKSIREISSLIHRRFVISRICYGSDGHIEVASSNTVLNQGDRVLVVTPHAEVQPVVAFIGKVVEMNSRDWRKLDRTLVSRRILVTQPHINGRTLGQLKLRVAYDINITRINRSGVDLVAQYNLKLQVGDRVTVVGSEGSVAAVEKILGNKMQRLNEPNLIPIFIGIALGVLLGSIPIAFPGIPHPVKLGLAGGPLIVAILISIFGSKLKLITYTTMSANLMLREVGIALFLACVGLGAGENFVKTIVEDGGVRWIAIGFIITVVPLLIVGFIGRKYCKLNYYTIMGLLAGSTTDPPALSYANSVAGNDAPSVSYATVYPLTMFLRVLSAQLLILLFL